MWEQEVAFWIIAVAMAGAAIGVVRSNNVVHAALFLVVVLAGSAAQYILLVAEFVAWVQVLIYIGAVIVLFLFGIMLTRAPMHPTESMDNNLRFWALVPSGLLAVVLGGLLIDAFGKNKIRLDAPTPNAAITNSIFRIYLVPFEVVGVLLLAALIGAVVLARKD